MVKNVFSIIIVSLFAFIAGFPLLHKGLPPTHDGEYHVVRFYEFYKTLSDGDFYPRWAPDLNNGFGIPLFNYVYPLPNYIAALFHFFGISFINSFKLEMFFAIIIGGIFFYLWSQEFWGKLGGVISSVFYTFSPYHFVDIYIRGSVGEVWALAFFPAFLWSITRFIKYKQKLFVLLSSVFLSLIIFSHNILALIFFFFALSYVIFLICQEKSKKYLPAGRQGLILNTFYIILLSLGLSSIFWLPAFLEKNLVRGLEIFDVTAHFPDLYQLLIPSWGSGFSGESLDNQLSFQIGIANLVAVFTSVTAVFIYKKKDKKSLMVLFFVLWFILVFFLMLKVSQAIWEIIPFTNYFQFPWRFLSLEILIVSFLAGSIVYFWKSKIFAIFLILLAFSLGIGYAKPAYYHYRDDNYYITRSNFIDGTNSPGNVFNTVFFNTNLKKQKEKLSFIEGSGGVNQEVDKSTRHVFDIKAEKESEITVNTAYFPGWTVRIDNKITKTYLSNDGLFYFYLPKGDHEIEIKFEDTFARKLGFYAFLISVGIIFYFYFRSQSFRN